MANAVLSEEEWCRALTVEAGVNQVAVGCRYSVRSAVLVVRRMSFKLWRRSAALFLSLCLLLLSEGCNWRQSEGARQSGSGGRAQELLVSLGPQIEFGALPEGSHKDQFFWLRNPTPDKIEIDNVRATCDCVQLMLPSRTIYPGERVGGNVALDVEGEPGTHLAIEVEATKKGGGRVFTVVVRAEIVKSSTGKVSR